jgi:hypothetical protein
MRNSIALFEKTTVRLRSQRPLHVQGDAGHPGHQKKNWKKWRAEEEERHKGMLTIVSSNYFPSL